eukprot:CAMPEP_0174851622 /NCGR_PEP_ID=MMETSP1114-20130205/23289_1 /TAXON_ID=312471 /ORGANISM="Neobodo designis, Strain CCAP 1951/1" /LENGTH=197 /DNA_ID=CAMNT_0016086169 /DNA_START=62 /DNA_END=652 /DNA_ORIENTATION=-
MPTAVELAAHNAKLPPPLPEPAAEDFESACSDELSTPPTAPGTPRNASLAAPGKVPNFAARASVAADLATKEATKPTRAAKAHEAPEAEAAPSMGIFIATIIGYITMIGWGLIREGFRAVFVADPDLQPTEGFAKLATGATDFFSRRVYRRIRDCWNRPINTRAGRVIGVMERKSDPGNRKFELTGNTIPCVNLASY